MSTSNQYNFTFIIPHKNTPDLLQKCLDSIPRRDDVQIIVVDDNSDPKKVDFNDFPGVTDKRVEVIFSQKSKGAGAARNIALPYAKGKWIIFADSDDYMLDGTEEAMNQYVNSKADVIFFKNKSIKIPSGEKSSRGYELNRRVDIAIETGDCTLALLYSSPWQKFFRRQMLIDNGIRFNEVTWGNDVVFMGRIAAAAKRLEAAPLAIYCITESNNSITKAINIRSCLCRFEQECENVSILHRTKYKGESSIYYWHFCTWFEVWKLNKISAIKLIPKAIRTSGGRFIVQTFKAKF